MNAKQTRVIRLVSDILMARRNGNVKREQASYDKLRDFCEVNNANFDNAYEGALKYLRNNDIALRMQGVILR